MTAFSVSLTSFTAILPQSHDCNYYVKVSKGLPQQTEVAQGVPGRLRPRIFLTFRHYKGGRSSAKRIGRLYPRRNPWYTLSEAESTLGHMVLSGEPRKKSPVTTPGMDPGTVRPVAQCLKQYATPGPRSYYVSRRTLAPPPLWWQKRTDVPAYDFAYSRDLWRQPWMANVTWAPKAGYIVELIPLCCMFCP